MLNWENFHFMITKGIVLGQKIFVKGIEVDQAKIDEIEKVPPSVNVKGVRNFQGMQVFIGDLLKIFQKF